jgi:hypothetical protein
MMRMPAATLALIGPIALMAIVGLNLALLWRRSSTLVAALRGPRPRHILLSAGGSGEPNIIAFPALTGAAARLSMAA